MYSFEGEETMLVLLARRNAQGKDILRTIRSFSGVEIDCEEVDDDLCGVLLKKSWTCQNKGSFIVVCDSNDRVRILSFEATPDRRAYSVVVNHRS